jgi:hypothetical protein
MRFLPKRLQETFEKAPLRRLIDARPYILSINKMIHRPCLSLSIDIQFSEIINIPNIPAKSVVTFLSDVGLLAL